MSEQKHTPGPWSYVGNVVDIPGRDMYRQGLHLNSGANARRIVACINACEGVDNDFLVPGAFMAIRLECIAIQTENSELIKALEALLSAHGGTRYLLKKQARTVLAKTHGGKV